MSGYSEACLSAIAFYEACRDENTVNQDDILRTAGQDDITVGLTALVGALLASYAAQCGSTEAVLVEMLRAMYVAGEVA